MEMNIKSLGERLASNFNFSNFLLGFIFIMNLINSVGKHCYITWRIRVLLVIRHIITIKKLGKPKVVIFPDRQTPGFKSPAGAKA